MIDGDAQRYFDQWFSTGEFRSILTGLQKAGKNNAECTI